MTVKFEEFIKRSRAIHQNIYEYDQNTYTGIKQKVAITCPQHGRFFQQAEKHYRSRVGCQKCAKESRNNKLKLSFDEFVIRAKHTHGDLYEYQNEPSLTPSGKTKIKICCKKHGYFYQDQTNHIQGSGCPVCVSSSRSKLSQKWLDSIDVPHEHREVQIIIDGKRLIVDGYNPLVKQVYEFWGDYWHGNPEVHKATDINQICKKTFADLYEATIERRRIIIEAGYKLIEIWEQDFISNSSLT